jgi:hypothetical protein
MLCVFSNLVRLLCVLFVRDLSSSRRRRLYRLPPLSWLDEVETERERERERERGREREREIYYGERDRVCVCV